MSINRLPKNRPKIAKNNLGYWQKIESKIFEFGLVCDLSWPVESGNFFLAHPVEKYIISHYLAHIFKDFPQSFCKKE